MHLSRLLFAASLLTVTAAAQGPPAMSASATQGRTWQSLWITSPDVGPRVESILHFRKEVDLPSVSSSFPVYVSADNEYILKVNGQYVGAGPSHGDLQHWRYATYDLAPLLHPGKNLIAATVWNFGDRAPVRQISDRTGFLMEGAPANPVDVKTGPTWEVSVESGISTNDTPQPIRRSYYVASLSENLFADKFDWKWDSPDSTGLWKKAVAAGRAAARGSSFAGSAWQLVPDTLPAMERSLQPTGKVARIVGMDAAGGFPSTPLSIPPHQKVTILIDAGHLTTAYPELAFSGGRGSTLKLTYAEALYDDKEAKGNRNEIENKKILGIADMVYPDGSADRTFLPLDWRTWRYLQIDVQTEDASLDLKNLRAWFTAYPFQEAAAFSSSDPSLKAIWDVGWLTARLCAHDTYMDTPYWERLQYVGDTRVQSLISYTVAGDDRLARQAISAFHDSTISDGVVLSHYPASEFQNIPGFSLYWIGMVHDFWMYRNDPAFVQAQMSVVRSTISYFSARQNKNHLLGRLPWWSFVDWAEGFVLGVPPQDADGDSAVLSLQFVEALRNASEMEGAVGNKDAAKQDHDQADQIAEAVRKLCWSEQYGLLADTPDRATFSQHANAFAVWLDVIPKTSQQAVMQKILSTTDPAFTSTNVPAKMAPASYYYRFYLARALVHSGLGDRYLDTLGPWKAMLANGLTTWAEQPEPTRSDSHAWSSHPNYDLLSVVAGITPVAPAFQRVHIEPRPGKLKYVDAAMPTPQGTVKLTLDLRQASPKATVTLPAGTTGVFTWRGKDYGLTAGENRMPLPSAINE